MKKTLDDKIYQDRKIFCRKNSCGFYVGRQTMDAQILILESGLIAFSFFSFQCPNGHNNSWLAPTLPDVAPTMDNQYPDTKMLERRAGITKLAYNRYRVRVKNKYIGVYPDEQTAVKVRDAALMEYQQT